MGAFVIDTKQKHQVTSSSNYLIDLHEHHIWMLILLSCSTIFIVSIAIQAFNSLLPFSVHLVSPVY